MLKETLQVRFVTLLILFLLMHMSACSTSTHTPLVNATIVGLESDGADSNTGRMATGLDIPQMKTAFLWGTEGGGLDPINNVLKVRHVKYRTALNLFESYNGGKTFSTDYCIPSRRNCKIKRSLDNIVRIYRHNNWSMLPMLSISTDSEEPITLKVIETYVNFVEWFVDRYKEDASIEYIELNNNPAHLKEMTPELLLELNNRTYERIKSKHPDILVGTPGFEYWMDLGTNLQKRRALEEIEYFLDPANGAKFDFWSFHGYGVKSRAKHLYYSYPPTKRALSNKYAGISGLQEIRWRLNNNGWSSRLIIDTENHAAGGELGEAMTEELDALITAYIVQELLLKYAANLDGKPILDGIITMQLRPRRPVGLFMLGSLRSDGSASRHVKAVGRLIAMLEGYRNSERVSGAFDDEQTVWIEKFPAAGKELYVFFKPLEYREGELFTLDEKKLLFVLKLPRMPRTASLTDIDGNRTTLPLTTQLNLEADNLPKFLEIEY